ncbi:hypothetical protein OIE66_13125 [Nonomuraea sp. NBC_01738]|uniref:hypothetical protein n=1 Tax=Nonomuraea sp. NBC_01738 TaxID=2976003 RepID=UPI002E12CCE4|nr:hypothetical protein OIE66_13125 [Nonomuraea sp. NBC_01738]
MKQKIVAAVAAGLAAVTLAPAAAQAHQHDHDSVRYASVKACKVKDGGTKPCGGWRLIMHSGERMGLPDAQVVARNADGSSSIYVTSPISVSGDGQKIAYLTKKGRLAVRTLGGGVRVFAANALPHVPQTGIGLTLSDDGARLAATFEGRGTRAYDTATGERLGTVPGDEELQGFSADGDEVLTRDSDAENSAELAVYGDDGREQRRATPPQVMVANGAVALNADGHTAAVVVLGKKPKLVTYDLDSDQITAKLPVKLPSGDLNMIDWTGGTQVTLHLTESRDDRPTIMRIVQIDAATGAVKLRDTYKVLADSYVFAACGG